MVIRDTPRCARWSHIWGSDGRCLRCDEPEPPDAPDGYDPLDDELSLASLELERALRKRPGTLVGPWSGTERVAEEDAVTNLAGWGEDGDPWQGGR